MLKAKNVDVLNGPLLKSIIIYSIPIMLMGLIQQLFNAVDIMVLNIMAGEQAVAEVGATTSVPSLLVDAFIGIAIGTRVVLARRLGEKNVEKAKLVASTSIYTALIIGVIVAIGGNLLVPYILRVLNCPEECFVGALTYLRIYLVGAPAILVYNYSSAIVQVSGDTRSSLYYMLFAGILNVTLNFALCAVLEQKVAAVAIATVASQTLGAVLMMRRLFRMEGLFRLSYRDMKWSNTAFINIMANGLPQAIYHSIYPISNMMVYPEINSFGAAAIAGHTAIGKAEAMLTTMATSSISSSVTAFMGQSLGAKNDERVKKSFLTCLALYTAIGAVMGVITAVFYRPLTLIFASDSAMTMLAAKARALTVSLFTFVSCPMSIFNRGLNTFGYAKLSMILSVASILTVRAVWMNFVYPLNPTLYMVDAVFPVSWAVSLCAGAIAFAWVYKYRFKAGKLKELR